MTAPTEALLTPSLSQSPRRLVLKQHRSTSHEDLPTVIGSTFSELYSRIGASGIAPAGPPFVVYGEGSTPGVHWEIDICAPIAAPIPATPEFEFAEMPTERIVAFMHVGPYDQLGRAYEAIERFVGENGLTVSGPPREIYFSEPDVPVDEIRTLIEQPIS